MLSINSPNFIENFDVSEMTVGIIGFGYVGRAIESFFSSECRTLVYDKEKKEVDLDTLEDVVRESHLIFVCVPTPMNKDGSCYTGIVEGVLESIRTVAKTIDRDTNEFVVVIKSTVTPGFTKRQNGKGGLRVIFSPEFLTERNSIEDFEKTNRVLFGGDDEDTAVASKFFERKLAHRAFIVMCDDSTALEMVKLFTNAYLMTKVVFANEMYRVCSALGVNYDEVMNLACLDKRIAYSHLNVPGHDGQFGAGGHCFPKDINNLRNVANELGTDELLFTAVIQRNNELRGHKDWEDMRGRAVVDDYKADSDGHGRDDLQSGEDGDVPPRPAEA